MTERNQKIRKKQMVRNTAAKKPQAGQRSRKELVAKKKQQRMYMNIAWMIILCVLCIIVPPVGLIAMWGTGSYNRLVRCLLSFAGVIVMTVFIGSQLPVKVPLSNTHPTVGVPIAAIEETDNDVMASLTDMEAILASQQKSQTTEETGDEVISSAQSMELEAQKQSLLNTMVYSTYGRGTRYYHSIQMCGTQKNTRVMTLAEALADHLGACPDCDAPIYNILSTEKVIGE